MEGSSAIHFGRAAYRVGMVSRRQLLGDAWANLKFRAERLDRRGHRGAAPADPRLDRGRAGQGPDAAGPRRAGRDPAAPLQGGARDRLGAPGRRPSRLHRHRRLAGAGRVAGGRARARRRDRHALGGQGRRLHRPPGGAVHLPRTGRPRRFASWPRQEGIDLAESYAYSDSESDLPMLRAVGHPVVVNPDRELGRLARDEGWQIMRFDKLGRRLKVGAAVGAVGLLGATAGGVAARAARTRRSRAPSGCVAGSLDAMATRAPRADRRRALVPREVRADAASATPSSRPSPGSRSTRSIRQTTCRTLSRSGFPESFPSRAGCTRRCTAGGCGRCASSPGFGTAEETNERFRYLLDHGQTGLSTAFDMPSLMGHDSDHPRSLGEVGREGVAIDTLDDMETLFGGIPTGRGLDVDDDQRAGGDHAGLLRRRRRASRASPAERLAGTIQTDILKEYIAQKEWCFPIDPAMRLVTDMIEFCSRRDAAVAPDLDLRLPHPRGRIDRRSRSWRSRSRTACTYVEAAIERGIDVDDFAPRLSFFFNAHIDFFEEIAKYRAARRIWARELRDTFGAKDERSLLMRFHSQTAGVSLTAQQPLNNLVRTALEALRGGARRHPVAAHQLLRRGARAADRGGGPARAADAADHRPRDRRDQHDRPARRLLLRRGADRPHGGPPPTSTSARSTSWAGWSRRSSRTTPSARSPTPSFRFQEEVDAASG